MNVRSTVVAFGFLASCVFATASQASPISVTCPEPGEYPSPYRTFTLVFDDAGGGTASCYDSGTGNNVTSFPGYTFIEKDETAGGASSGWMTSDVVFGTSLTGTISIDPHIANQNLLLVLKSGVGNGDPDWVVFALTPTILSSAFSIVSPGPGSQALSHMELYGGRGPIPAPEPASLLLFGTGLLGVGRAARKRLHASRPEASE